MPAPLSRTVITASFPSRSAVSQIRPPRSVYLAALLSRLVIAWASRTRSASRWIVRGASDTLRPCSRSSISGRLTSSASSRTSWSFTRFLRSGELVARDPRDVQQVFHEADHLLGLPVDHVERGLRLGRDRPLDHQRLHRVADRRQPVPQLVSQDREELVLDPVGLAEHLARAFLERDVARDLRGADHAAAAIVDRRDRERDVDAPAVLREPHGLEVTDALARAQPRQDHLLLARALRRNDHEDRLADRLVGGIAEQPLGALVPGEDPTVQRLADDRVVGRIDDRGEARLDFVRLRAVARVDRRDPSARLVNAPFSDPPGSNHKSVSSLPGSFNGNYLDPLSRPA